MRWLRPPQPPRHSGGATCNATERINDNRWQMKRQKCWTERCAVTHSMPSSASPSTITPSTSFLRFFPAIWISAASASHCESTASIFLWYSWLAKTRRVSWIHGPITVSKSSMNVAWKMNPPTLPSSNSLLLSHSASLSQSPVGTPEIVTPHTCSWSAAAFKKTEKLETSRVGKISQRPRLHSFTLVDSSIGRPYWG